MTLWSGVVAIVLTLVAFLVFTKSNFPDSNDGPAKIASYYAQHRSAALTQQFLLGLSAIALACFAAGLVMMMWRVETTRPAAVVAAIGAAGGIGVFLAGSGLAALLAYRTPAGDPGLMRAELDGSWIMLNISGFMLGMFIAAVSYAAWRAHVLPAWVGEFGAVVALAQFVGAASYARGDGGFSPQGWVPLVAALAYVVWVATVCFAVWRPQEAVTPAPSAPAPAA
jgi:hypothetical protein